MSGVSLFLSLSLSLFLSLSFSLSLSLWRNLIIKLQQGCSASHAAWLEPLQIVLKGLTCYFNWMETYFCGGAQN